MTGAESVRRSTIRDVAERAGVSISTVSHAMSGRRAISEPTRARVARAAADLGYDPNPSARSLRTGRSGMVGLILRPRDAVHGSLGGTETFNRLSGAVATEMLDRKIGLIHVPDILDPAVAQVPMDGCIVAHPYGNDDVLGELLRRGVPVVTVEEDPDRPEFAWSVTLDHTTAMTTLLDELHARGAARTMLVSGTEDNAWNRRTRETYVAWCRRRGRPPWHTELYEGRGAEGAAELAATVLTGHEPPDTIIAAASRFAAGVAETATRNGIDIPDDLMLAALTDSEFTRGHHPPITAVDLVLERLAACSVDLMLRRLDGAAEPDAPLVVEPVLHRRASTGRDPSRRTAAVGPGESTGE